MNEINMNHNNKKTEMIRLTAAGRWKRPAMLHEMGCEAFLTKRQRGII